MNPENPYDAPRSEAPVPTVPPRLLVGSIATVLGTACVGGLLGMSIGAALGSFVPSYYRSVFADGDAPHFDPVAVGIGQGLTQGVVFGGIVGLILVAMFYRHRARAWTVRT